MDLKSQSVSDLLQLYSETLRELRSRGVIRSSNNPVADYTEHLVSDKLGLIRLNNSAPGADAEDKEGKRYQIKARRLTAENRSPALSGIRNLNDRPFDFLVAVVFRQDFTVDYAAQLPYEVVRTEARYSRHTNASVLVMTKKVLELAGVSDLTEILSRP